MISSVSKIQNSHQFLLDGVAFYGRTLSEYEEMFFFQAEELVNKRVLDCAAGPSSFAAESSRMGINSVACDPLYSHSCQDLIPRAEMDMKQCLSKSNKQRELFYSDSCDIDTHYVGEKQRALFNFSRDYTDGKAEGRYIAGALPNLPFASNSFDLVLSAHFLFIYASKENGGIVEDNRFSVSFHNEAIIELIRVAREEVRIYPLKGPNKPDSPMLELALETLKKLPVDFELIPVDYRDVAGANLMLRIRKK